MVRTKFWPPIGAGGMGEVYRAKDSRLEREVAIKVLPAEYSSDPTPDGKSYVYTYRRILADLYLAKGLQ